MLAVRCLAGLVLLVATSAFAEPRAPLSGVSFIRIANYNAPSVVFKDRDTVNAVVAELNQLRRKEWRKGDAKLSCYSTLVLVRGEKKSIGEFRIRPDAVVDRPVEKGQSVQHVPLDPAELPRIRKLLAEIPPLKDCN